MNRFLSLRLPSTSTLSSLTKSITSTRSISTSTLKLSKPTFNSPGPPLLSRSEQKDFDELQRKVNTPLSNGVEFSQDSNGGIVMNKDVDEEVLTMHPDFRKKRIAAFEGRENPETGELDGPKNNPLEHGDWSQNGRCTDF